MVFLVSLHFNCDRPHEATYGPFHLQHPVITQKVSELGAFQNFGLGKLNLYTNKHALT